MFIVPAPQIDNELRRNDMLVRQRFTLRSYGAPGQLVFGFYKYFVPTGREPSATAIFSSQLFLPGLLCPHEVRPLSRTPSFPDNRR